MDIKRLLIDHSNEIANIAAECGIDWLSCNDIKPGFNKNPAVVKSKYKGKSVFWVEERTSAKGNDYLKITFHTKKHGEMTKSWASVQNQETNSFFKNYEETADVRKLKEKEDQKRKESFEKFKEQFEVSPQVGESNYLREKGIPEIIDFMDIRRMSESQIFGRKSNPKKFIAYALFGLNGEYLGLQRIYDGEDRPKESKKLTPGLVSGHYRGAHTIIGNPESAETMGIAEGLATAATYFLQTGNPCVVCYSAGNMELVAGFIKSRYENCKLEILADNDISPNGNTGVYTALEVAKKHGLDILVPPSIDGGKSDWNDVFVALGSGDFSAALKDPTNRVKPKRSNIDFLFQVLPFANRQKLEKLIKRIAAATKIPFVMSVDPLANVIDELLGGRYSSDRIRRAIRAVSTACKYRAKELSEIRQSSVDKTIRMKTVQNEKGHWILSEKSVLAIMEALSKGECVILRGPMGIGKTEILIKKIIDLCDRAAHILPRISVVDDAAKRLDLQHYRQVDHLLVHHTDKITSCINSMGSERFWSESGANWFSRLDALCIDEASQVLAQITQLGSARQKMRNHNAFSEAIKTAKGVLITDADANEFLVEQYRKVDPSRKITLVDVSHPENAKRSWNIEFTDKVSDARNRFIDDIKEGRKCLLATDNKRQAKNVFELLKLTCPDKKILIVHRDPDKEIKQEIFRFYEDPNEVIKDYDGLIYTPSITSGVSITEDHFERHYGIFQSVVGANDIIQMMGRDRTACNWFLGISDGRRRKTLSEFQLSKGLEKLGEGLSGFSALDCATELYLEKSRCQLTSLLLHTLKLKGHDIRYVGETVNAANYSKALSEIGKCLEEERIEKILNQPEISEQEYTILKNQWLPSSDDQAALTAYRIRNYLCMDVSRESIEFFENSGMTKIAMFELLYADKNAIHDFDTEQQKNLDPVLRTHAAKKKAILLKIFSLLGIDFENDFMGEFNHQRCQKVLRHFIEHVDELNIVFGLKIDQDNPPKDATIFVQKILEKIGLSLGKRKSNGRMIRFVEFSSASLMHSIMSSRFESKQSILKLNLNRLEAA